VLQRYVLCLLAIDWQIMPPKTSKSNSVIKRRKLNSATWITEHPVNNCAKSGFLLNGLYSASACTNLQFLYRNHYIGFSPYIYIYIYLPLSAHFKWVILFSFYLVVLNTLNRLRKHNPCTSIFMGKLLAIY
jgi:hypothetical protein